MNELATTHRIVRCPKRQPPRGAVSAAISASPAARERRRAPRVARQGHLTIFPCGAGGLGDGLRARFRDASARGIGLTLPAAVPAGEQFLIRLGGADGKPLSILYTIVRCRRLDVGKYDVGAELACVVGRR
jgi:hypothetical protein